MRAFLAFLLLSAAAVSASAGHDPLHACTEAGCVQVFYDDEGNPEGALATSGSDHHGLTVYAFPDWVLVACAAEGDHDAPEHHEFTCGAEATLVDHDGNPSAHEVSAFALVQEYSHGTGSATPVHGASARLHDGDGDGVPEFAGGGVFVTVP